MRITKGCLVYPTLIGHYNIHYPNWDQPQEIDNDVEIEAEKLPFTCFEDKTLSAFLISRTLMTQLGFSIPVLWAPNVA